MLSPCWGIPDVTQWFWWLQLPGWCCPSILVSRADFIRAPYLSSVPREILVYESNPHSIQELKDNVSHAVTAIKITTLHRVYLNMVRLAQLCIDAKGNHLQHQLWWYILSAFGYCINFCIYAMLRTRLTFSWPTLYVYISNQEIKCKDIDVQYNKCNFRSAPRKSTHKIGNLKNFGYNLHER